jgi:hypothetical protein
MSVRGVRRFPGDSRLYLQYLQLMGTEQAVALPRGLTRFPEVPELRLLAAREARRSGNRRVAIQRNARRHRARLVAGHAVSRPRRSAARGEPGRQCGRGAYSVAPRAPAIRRKPLRSYVPSPAVLQQLRAAADTAPARQRMALHLLLLADSVDSREDSRATVAAASLQVARSHLVDAFRTNACADVQRADATLIISAAAIGGGLGNIASAGEIVAAFDAMRKAVSDALATRCKGAP